jgi:hypothetical protein
VGRPADPQLSDLLVLGAGDPQGLDRPGAGVRRSATAASASTIKAWLAGKKALVTVTLGGREHMFGEGAIHGPLEDMLRPLLRGTLAYVGLDVLPNRSWRGMCRTSAKRPAQQFLLDYRQRLQHLSDDQPLVFPKLSQFDDKLYPLTTNT